MYLHTCIRLSLCTLGLAATAVLNAQEDVDPRIGVWEEQKTSTHFESIRRVLENIPGGMTRMVVNAKVDAANRQHVDFRCDGKQYPLLSASDRPTGVMYSCRRAGNRVVESSLTSVGVPASLDTAVREVVSDDGQTLTMSITPGAGKMRIEESQRHFVRQQP